MKIAILCLKKILQNHLIYSWANNGEFNVKEGTARERDEIIKKNILFYRLIVIDQYMYIFTDIQFCFFFENRIQLLLFYSGKMAKRRWLLSKRSCNDTKDEKLLLKCLMWSAFGPRVSHMMIYWNKIKVFISRNKNSWRIHKNENLTDKLFLNL